MNLNQRQQQILQRVQQQGFVSIEDLAASFNVTPQTIRRDINILCDLGVLRRFHGGAGLPSSVENIAYPARQVLYLDEKRRIAKLVAQHIPDQSSLFINIGTTTEEVAKALVDHSDMRVITNNLNVATLLCDKPGFEVIITGGVVRHRDRGVVGEATVDFIQKFKVDFGIIGISGIDADGTLLDFDYREVRVSQAILMKVSNNINVRIRMILRVRKPEEENCHERRVHSIHRPRHHRLNGADLRPRWPSQRSGLFRVHPALP